MLHRLEGILIPAVTTFGEDGAVNLEMMEFNYRRWNKTGVRGYMCLGSNGEFRSLSDDESFMVIQAAGDFRDKEKTLIAGVGRESLYQTLKFIDRVQEAELELDYISVLTPCYFSKLMTDEALVDYYTKIADFSRYPLLLYCAPGFANSVCLSVEAVQKLSDHPNIHGIKDTSTTMMKDYMGAFGQREDFDILAGSLNNLMACLEGGGRGGVVSAANYFPELCSRIPEIYQESGSRETQEYVEKLKALVRDTGGSKGIAGVKYCMNLAGYQGGVPRLPVQPLSDGGSAPAEAFLEEKYDCEI